MRRTVIAITGTNGIGKTTIVRWIFRRSFVRDRFDCTIWVNVPQKIKLADLLSCIVQQATGVMEPRNITRNEEEIMSELTKKLSEKKYLIVLDGVRNFEEWKVLLSVLSNTPTKGSRVVIITQVKLRGFVGDYNKMVDERIGRLCNHHLEIQKLDVEQGKELFCARVFGLGKKEIPEDFWNADAHSKSIEKLVDGSPLRITLLAGLLRSKARDEWAHIIDQLQYLPDDKPPTATYFEKQQQQQQLRQEQRQEVKQQQQELQQGQKEPQKQQQEGQLEKQQKQPEEQEENKLPGQLQQQLKKYKKQIEEQKQERERLQIQIQQLLEKQQQQDQQHKKEKPNHPSIKYKQISLTEKILSLSLTVCLLTLSNASFTSPHSRLTLTSTVTSSYGYGWPRGSCKLLRSQQWRNGVKCT